MAPSVSCATQHQHVLDEIESDTPKIAAGDAWILYDRGGSVYQRLSILAEYHADHEGKRRFIYEVTIAGLRGARIGIGSLGVLPEYNLRRLYQLEGSVTNNTKEQEAYE